MFASFSPPLLSSHLVSRDGNPGVKIAWIIPILALPVFGVLLYLVFGKTSFAERKKARMSSVAEQHEKATRSVPGGEPALPGTRKRGARPSALYRRRAGIHACT